MPLELAGRPALVHWPSGETLMLHFCPCSTQIPVALQTLDTSSLIAWSCGSTSHFAAQVAGPTTDVGDTRQTALPKHLSDPASHLSLGAKSHLGAPWPQ